ncbi:MAG: DUF2924 domain-containing protein [Polyangiaceae bacterium]|jgi:hypothetical protein|nr:DUF2924 domain-containing protein [Polyangiaceae bacterium]
MHARAEARTHARVTINELQLRVEALDAMTVAQLREEYERVFDEPTASRNKRYLAKRIAYRMQELVHGGLSELARRRIDELARNAPIRRKLLFFVPPPSDAAPPCPETPTTAPTADPEQETAHVSALPAPPPRARDPRLPPAGTLIRKRFHETDYEVRILDSDFELAGKCYRSLSGVARAITGTGWNGFLFFERELAQAKGGEP